MHSSMLAKNKNIQNTPQKNLAYGRQEISGPMRRVAPLQLFLMPHTT